MLYLPTEGLVVPPIPDEPTEVEVKEAKDKLLICERGCSSTGLAGSSLLAGRGGPSWGQGGVAGAPRGRRP
jgi:hypothetical protein